ncbi:DoxX-like family protein [Pseudoxanthomonas suwonensis]
MARHGLGVPVGLSAPGQPRAAGARRTPGGLADVALWSGALLDALLGIAMLVLPGRRPVYYAQLLLMAGYTVLISLWLPEFWLHPFAPC